MGIALLQALGIVAPIGLVLFVLLRLAKHRKEHQEIAAKVSTWPGEDA